MAYGRPVVATRGRRPRRRDRDGVLVPPGDVRAAARGARASCSPTPSWRAHLGAAGARAAREQLAPEVRRGRSPTAYEEARLVKPSLLLHALRTAQPRQLRGAGAPAAAAPAARRRHAPPLPAARRSGRALALARVRAAAARRSTASERLRGFHAQYGEEVLAAARAGDAPRRARLLAAWIEQQSAARRRCVAPVHDLDAGRQLDRRALAPAGARDDGGAREPLAAAGRARARTSRTTCSATT